MYDLLFHFTLARVKFPTFCISSRIIIHRCNTDIGSKRASLQANGKKPLMEKTNSKQTLSKYAKEWSIEDIVCLHYCTEFEMALPTDEAVIKEWSV